MRTDGKQISRLSVPLNGERVRLRCRIACDSAAQLGVQCTIGEQYARHLRSAATVVCAEALHIHGQLIKVVRLAEGFLAHASPICGGNVVAEHAEWLRDSQLTELHALQIEGLAL